MSDQIVKIIDPSEVYRPEAQHKNRQQCHDDSVLFNDKKNAADFRRFSEFIITDDPAIERARLTYKLMHTYQTVDFVQKQHSKWDSLDKKQMTIMEALDFLNNLVDESDPDCDVPNIYHAFQTAERIREVHPDKDWFHLVGLIHDLGKVLALWGEPQWCTVGDTFPVGCEFASSIVYSHNTFDNNPDKYNSKFNTHLGMYEEHCGLNKVYMSWGHDEYMYQVLVGNKSTIPEEGLSMVRYHSFYPWHTGGDYFHLCNNQDLEMLHWIREFNKFDLYSKSDGLPDIEALKPYYQSLIDKYVPGIIKW